MAIDKQAVEARVRECLALGNKKFGAKARVSKIIYLKNATRVKGKAISNHGEMIIQLSAHFLEKEFQWMMDEIIPHEVAHIIGFWLLDHGEDGTQDHDARWQEIAKSLGSSGESHPTPPETYARKDRYHYKTSTGNDLYLSQDKHDIIQNQFKTFTDTRDGGRVTAANYVQ